MEHGAQAPSFFVGLHEAPSTDLLAVAVLVQLQLQLQQLLPQGRGALGCVGRHGLHVIEAS